MDVISGILGSEIDVFSLINFCKEQDNELNKYSSSRWCEWRKWYHEICNWSAWKWLFLINKKYSDSRRCALIHLIVRYRSGDKMDRNDWNWPFDDNTKWCWCASVKLMIFARDFKIEIYWHNKIRKKWKVNSESNAKWMRGKVGKIFNDDDGEWLEIQNDDSFPLFYKKNTEKESIHHLK